MVRSKRQRTDEACPSVFRISVHTMRIVALAFGVALLGAGVVSAAQPETTTQTSSKTANPAAGGGKASQSIKVTVVRSVGASSGDSKKPAGTGSTTPSTDSQRISRPARTQPAAQNRTKAKTASAPASKPQTAAPTPTKPQAPPPHPAPHESNATHQAPQSPSEGLITIEGSVTGLDLKAIPPVVQLTLPFGPLLTLTADAATTVIMREGHAGTLNDLQVHDEGRVLYVAETHLIKSIDIKEATNQRPNQPSPDVAKASPTKASP